jgi:uncharacterized protein involved in outer membrane biogenesis
MKRILVAVAVVALVVLLAVVGYGIHLVRWLDTPAFKATLLGKAKAALGTDVEVSELGISLFSGVTLKGVTIANPAPFSGSLLQADAFVLRYRLLPLLRGRLVIDELSLREPVISLASDKRGVFNYERLGAAPTRSANAAVREDASVAAGRPTPAGAGVSVPLSLVLSKLAVEDARVSMMDGTVSPPATLIGIEDADFDSSVEVGAKGAAGKGEARIKLVNLADLLFLRDAKADLAVSAQKVKLAPISAKLAKGEAKAELELRLKDFRYEMSLEVKGADVETLMAEAKAGAGVSGTLVSKADFEGTGGMATIKGKGRAAIRQCRLSNVKVLALLAALIQVPELANPDFEQCVIDFRVRGYRVVTPLIDFKGSALQIAGNGTMNMESGAIAYDLSLALAEPLLRKIPVQETRAAFKPRADGLSAVDFKVYGTSDAPRTDLATRLGKAAAAETARKGAERLLSGKKLF